jgi:endogenous inhibitor of DNA gyrase (YacG/DUF329 family)
MKSRTEQQTARCQGCGAELEDPTQPFCGGDRCLAVLMRAPEWPGPPWRGLETSFRI